MPPMPSPAVDSTVLVVFATLLAVAAVFAVVVLVAIQIGKRKANRMENIRRYIYRTNTAATEKTPTEKSD